MVGAGLRLFASSSLLCIAGLSAPALAQAGTQRAEAGDAQIADIVVTAERRASSVQSTPIAINAVTGESLAKQQVSNIEMLTTKLPNVSFSRNGGDARVFIRGIGLDSISPGSDPRVAIYTDGTYHARAQAALGAFFDIERVEVLSGPQGTLYGRNATAGAINLISRDPGKQVNGYARLTVGNYSAVRTEGAVGGALSNAISARLAFQTSDRSGYGTNIVTGQEVDDEHTRALRGKLRYQRGALTMTVQADYFFQDDHTGGYHHLGQPPGTAIPFGVLASNPRDIGGAGPATKMEAYGFSSTMDYELGDLTLTSISSHKHLDAQTYTSPDASTLGEKLLPLDIVERSDVFTQEVRLGGRVGIIDLVVGGYYFYENNFAGNDAGINTLYFGGPDFLADGAVNRGNQKTRAYAVFTQNTINITDRLGVDLGARYSYEKRSAVTINRFNLGDPYVRFPLFTPHPTDATVAGRRSWTSFDPKVGIHFQATPDLFLYASYSTGFKSGGFNVAFIQPAFDPEEIQDFEAGVKADLFDRRLRFNLAAFYYKYRNLQVNVTGGPSGTQLITENAARAELYGAEVNITARPVRPLEINFDAAYLHSEFQDYTTKDPSGLYTGQPLPNGTPANPDGSYDLAGNPLTYAPTWRLHGAIAYEIEAGDLTVRPRADVTYTSRVEHTAFDFPFTGQSGYTLFDLYLDFELEKAGLSGGLFMKNVGNKFYKLSSTISSPFFGYPLTGLVGAPRTFGASITKRF